MFALILRKGDVKLFTSLDAASAEAAYHVDAVLHEIASTSVKPLTEAELQERAAAAAETEAPAAPAPKKGKGKK